ncbi:hypothetical protein BDF20DRAFT_814908 [Mycotypha africana]|uniref:uncharacterized protein n=1 Tax=Mycotypha africana TaxID=64632 RepID=UPI002300E28C|nr:uncharacterized protein BDF20DRAFT_814908 [Mycotypha africana]KAI8988623.1 hypothetical protein BDF20DRAFT_814908 [Mycotypha africana]
MPVTPTPEDEKNEPIFEIVYNAPTAPPSDIITPPPSPKSSPRTDGERSIVSESFKANDRILTVKRQGQMKLLKLEYAALKREGLLFTEHTYNLIFEAYASLRRDGTPLTPMLNIYEDMLRSGIQPCSSTYTILIRTLCKRDVEVQKVIAMLKRQNARCKSITASNNNMSDLESEANLQKALVMFEDAVSENLVQFFEVDLFNQLLRVLSHYGDVENSLRVYHQLELHAQPTSATYAALINLFGRVGDLESALTFFQHYSSIKDTVGPHDASYVYNALVDAHLKCHHLEDALKIVQKDMLEADVKISTIPYNSIIRYYCLQPNKKLEEAMDLLQTMKQSYPQPDASSYGPVLSAYCQMGCFKKATEIYQALIQTDISKSYGNMANYALLCLKQNDMEKAMQVVEDMKKAGLEPDPALAQHIVTRFAIDLKQPEHALNALTVILESMKPRSVAKGVNQLKQAALAVSNALAASDTVHIDTALTLARLFTKYLTNGTHQNHMLPLPVAKVIVEAYNFDSNHCMLTATDYEMLFDAAITLASTTTSNRKASISSLLLEIASEMSVNGFKIASHTEHRVVSYLNRVGDKQTVQKWRALSAGFKKDNSEPEGFATLLSHAVMTNAMQGRLEEAVFILRARLVESLLVPLVEPLRDAIAFVGKQGNLQTADTMYKLAISCFQQPSPNNERAVYILTNSILIGYAQQGDMVQAKKYYEAIKHMGRYPDGNGYASLLLGCAKCATDEATDALTIYEEAKRHDVKPTTFFYNVVISKLAKARKLDKAMQLFEEMQRFKIQPNAITYGAIISACVRAGAESLAVRLFDDMLAAPHFRSLLRVGPFNNMIQFYVRQNPNRERALAYFEQMKQCGVKPSAHTYKLLMEVYTLIAPYDMKKAHGLLEEMERVDGVRPQATHYATLIYAYGTIQMEVEAAEKVFYEEMSSSTKNMNQVEKDEVVYQSMIDTLVTNDQLTRAEALYQEMKVTIGKSTSPYIENVFIRGYGQKGLLDKARALFDSMIDDKIQQNDEERRTIREPSTYEAMVRAYVDNQKIEEAQEIYQMMIQREFPEKVTASVGELLA